MYIFSFGFLKYDVPDNTDATSASALENCVVVVVTQQDVKYIMHLRQESFFEKKERTTFFGPLERGYRSAEIHPCHCCPEVYCNLSSEDPPPLFYINQLIMIEMPNGEIELSVISTCERGDGTAGNISRDNSSH